MPWNGTGTFALGTAAIGYQKTSSSADMNAKHDDLVNGLNLTLLRDGQASPTANLPMGSYRHTGAGAAVEATDYARADQVQNGGFTWCGTAGGTADALTLTPAPAATAYAAGQFFRFEAAFDNTSSTVTVNVSGLGTKTIGGPIAIGQIQDGEIYEIVYNGTEFRLGSLVSEVSIYTRSQAEAASIPAWQSTLTVSHGGIICDYVRDASGTALTTGDGQDWSPAGGHCTPAHWGALPGVATDYATELNSLSDYVKASYSASAGAYEANVNFAGQVWRTDSGFRMISARSGGLIIQNGAIWVSGSGKIGLDLTDCHTVTVRDVEVIGDTTTPPDVGFLLSRSGAHSLRASPRHTLINCSTTGEFNKFGRLRIASEVSTEIGCSWSNESKALTAFSDGCVDHAGALDDHAGGVTSPNATLPVASDGAMSNTVHDDTTSKSIRRAKVNLTVTGITKANPAVVTVSTGTLAGSGLSNGDKVFFTLMVGMAEVEGIVHTVANISGDTFELSGVDSTSYATFTSGTVQNQTGPGTLLAGTQDYTRRSFYGVVYGSPSVVIDAAQTGGAPPRDVDWEGLHERDPMTVFDIYLPAAGDTKFKGFRARLLNAAQHISGQVFKLNGAGTISMDSGFIYINNMGAAPANGVWSDASKVNISVGFTEDLPIEAALNATSAFSAYRGERVAHNSAWQVEDHREADFYGSPSLNGSAFMTIATATTAQLTDISDAVNTTNKQAGVVRFNSTTGIPVYASGSGASATWKQFSDNAIAHTPA